jgi:hypothetical protein
MPKSINIALCLSGGGFRATLFHLGVLKRLHELGLLAHVRMVSAVSGGAVTAALFHRHVDRPRYFGETNGDNEDDIFDRLERDDRPLAYDWEAFETQLLQATRAGILGPYIKSLGIWALSALALSASAVYRFAANWAFAWIFPLASVMALLTAVILYRSLFPQAREYVRQREFYAEGLKKAGEHAESFFASSGKSVGELRLG